MLIDAARRLTIVSNRALFESYILAISRATSLEAALEIAERAVWLATTRSTGYYSSKEIEDVFLRLASNNSVALQTTFTPQSVLHVMTQCYAVGGHTRVVERWIEQDAHFQHSVFLTAGTAADVTARLSEAVSQRKGRVLLADPELSLLERSLKLRQVASGFDLIVLHVHPHDPTPLVAFGTREFTRPVILYNHADHLFWINLSVADVIAETRGWGMKVTRNKRGCDRSINLGIPIDTSITAGANLVISGQTNNRKLLLSVGSAYKYTPVGSWNFWRSLKRLLRDERELDFVGIGLSQANAPHWVRSNEFKSRVRLLGYQKHSEVVKYAKICRVAWDSFPQSGGTALMDISISGAAVVALDCPTGHLDYLNRTGSIVRDESELLVRTRQMISDDWLRLQNVENNQTEINSDFNLDSWRKNLLNLYKSAGLKHQVYEGFTTNSTNIDALDLFKSSINRSNGVRGIVSYAREILSCLVKTACNNFRY
ncbi:hypothetical protein Brsp05_01864 [Brucella sp. NBRC 12953]|uniref:hypothetical protein n=1 Tax=Brucella sp. NBRC 12953 TaxID=3075481 RepID=UPI000DE51709